MKQLYIILLVFVIDTLAFAEASITNNSNFSIKDISSSNLKNPKLRKKLQILFIDSIVLDWIQKNKRLPIKKDIGMTDPSKIHISSSLLIGIKKQGILGLFDSFTDFREKILERIKERNLTSKYIFIFSVHLAKNFDVDKKDLLIPKKRSQIQLYIIDKFILPWMSKNDGSFPKLEDFNKKSKGVGITLRLLFSTPIELGIFDSMSHLRNLTYSRIKELGLEDRYSFCQEYDNENKFLKIIEGKDLNNPEEKKQAQILFIEQFILPWVETNNRFPTLKDFGVEKHHVGYSYHKTFLKPLNSETKEPLFRNIRELKALCYEYVSVHNLSTKYPILSNPFFPARSLDKKIPLSSLTDINEKRKLQKALIIEYIIPWVVQNKRLPGANDFGYDNGKIGISYNKICSKANEYNQSLFESIYDIRSETFKILKELNLDSLLDEIFQSSLNARLNRVELIDPDTREILQNIFIRKYIIPWLDSHNGVFPMAKQYGYGLDKAGISYEKIFKEKIIGGEIVPALFESFSELEEKTNQLLKEDNIQQYYRSTDIEENTLGQRPLDYGISQKDLSFEDRRQIIREIFINQYILPWIKRNNGRTPDKKDFGQGADKVGLTYQIVVGERLIDGTVLLGIFDSVKEFQREVDNCSALFNKIYEDTSVR